MCERPDFQGVWTNVTLTPMERPAQFAGKATISDAEAAAYVKKDLETNNIDDPKAPLLARAGSAGTGGYNNLFIDRGTELARVDGQNRTSLIIDPPDGKMPAVRGKDPAAGRGRWSRRRLRGHELRQRKATVHWPNAA